MIGKIVKIKNVGRFHDYSCKGDVAFRKLTLIYAENGRGKTTLCSILRSLQGGDANHINERKTLGVADLLFIHMRINDIDFKFENNRWATTFPNIVIFDPVFINDNVYSGDYVDHEHKKNLYRIIVGEPGVRLTRQVEDFDGKIRDCNADLRLRRDAVLKNMPMGVALDDYLQWQPIIDIDTKIQLKIGEYDTRKRAIAKADEIRAKSLFARIKLPEIPSDFGTTLAKQLDNIIADAEIKIKIHIAQHQMDSQGESWLSQGLDYVIGKDCPFCGQDITANQLVAAYRSYFNLEYNTLKQEVAGLGSRMNDILGEAALSDVHQGILDNKALSEFWSQFIEVKLPDISFFEIQKKYAILRDKCLDLTKKKQDNPLDRVSIDDDFSSALKDVKFLSELIDSYNKAVDLANAQVDNQKSATQDKGGLSILATELESLIVKMKRFEPNIKNACQVYQETLNLKTTYEEQKEAVRQELNRYCEDILRTYENDINEYLDMFNTGFRIVNTRHLYTGGTPSSHYQIQINNTSVELGDLHTPPGVPCFRTTLSSGDKSALALAFFLAILKQDADISQRVIVFDDPFTSLDRFRRICTQQLIQGLAESAQQVIVLSHDPFFLKSLSDESSQASIDSKTLQISTAADNSVILEWDAAEELQSPYMKDYSMLLGFYRNRMGNTREVVRCIRPFLESWLDHRFPGHFNSNEWLGDYIDKIRNADSQSGLQHAKANLVELENINNYSKRYYHQQNKNADSEPIDHDQLHGFVKRTLRITGGNE